MGDITFDLSETTGRVCKRPHFGWDFIPLESVDSTNSYSKEHCGDWPKPTIVVAKHQTGGRGRGKNTWDDEGEGRSFLSTWCMELMEGPADPRWTLGIGLYLFESMTEAFKPVRFSLKEPNDIYIGDKKVGGILVEATSQGELHYLHVGIGINVFSYPASQTNTATHLNAFLGSTGLTPESWMQFLEFFGGRLLHFEKKAVSAENGWLQRLSGRLAEAMNRHPSHQENPVKQVQGDGTVILERGEINWKEL